MITIYELLETGEIKESYVKDWEYDFMNEHEGDDFYTEDGEQIIKIALTRVALRKDLESLRNKKESELQDKIARENGIDLDFSCDICVFDYEEDYKEECKEIAKLDKLIEGETK